MPFDTKKTTDFKRYVNPDELNNGALIEIAYCGNGCCLIKKKLWKILNIRW
ncbi:hypothetical protein J4418_00465 [Candidatus Woesearchaeota archaeon]|nr:hypothetical protein [Candidatus Woesearchaeota archaeon]